MSDNLCSQPDVIKPRPPDIRPRLLRDLAVSFLRLGLTAFGGPAAHIALMDEEFVRRRRWLTREEFLDMWGASNLIPGPTSTEMTIHLGHQQAGWRGLVLAGTCFILPAMLMVMGCAWLYVSYGSLPQIQSVLYGVKPVIIAVIFQALWRLGRTAVKSKFLAAVGLLAVAGTLAGGNVLLILLAAGLAAIVESRIREGIAAGGLALLPVVKPLMATAAASAVAVSIGLPKLFLAFLKFGAVIFGSGYVLLAFLQSDLVTKLHWMTQAQLLDAVAVGQITPGPVFTTATFIGYLLAGVPGALVATAGIFIPGFIFVAASRPLIPRLRRSKLAAAFLDGVNVGAVALMIAVTWQLSRAAVIDPLTAGIAALSAAVLVYFRINAAWLILVGSVAGFVAVRYFGLMPA